MASNFVAVRSHFASLTSRSVYTKAIQSPLRLWIGWCNKLPLGALSSHSTVPSSRFALWPQSVPRVCFSSTPSSSPGCRPFTILGVQQIAIGCVDREPLHRLWLDIFGLQPKQSGIVIPSENVIEDILTVGLGDTAVEIDLMTPIDPEKSPKVHVPPLNHLGLWVDDLSQAVEWMTTQGVRFAPGGIRTGAAGYDVAFIHPKGNESFPISGNGVLIELVQAPASVIAALQPPMAL